MPTDATAKITAILSRRRGKIPGILPNANFLATVYHGLPVDLLQPTFHSWGGYVAFLGRISPEKGIEQAIRIARAHGIPLMIAGHPREPHRPWHGRADREREVDVRNARRIALAYHRLLDACALLARHY